MAELPASVTLTVIAPDQAERAQALQAAEGASAAAMNLIGFARNGPSTTHFAFADEVAGMLAEALALTCQIERPRAGEEEAAAIIQLTGALERFGEVFGCGMKGPQA